MKKQTKAVAYTELAKAAAKLRRLMARRNKKAKQATKGGHARD